MDMDINVESCNGGNENLLSYPIKKLKYHYPDEITVITR